MSAIARFSPFAALDAQFEDILRRALPEPPVESMSRAWYPAANVVQEGADALIVLELPGVRMEDISVQARDGVVTVSGKRRQPLVSEDVQVLREEIRPGGFRRSFRIPAGTDVDAVTAAFDDGMLKVRLPGARKNATDRTVPVQREQLVLDALSGSDGVGQDEGAGQ